MYVATLTYMVDHSKDVPTVPTAPLVSNGRMRQVQCDEGAIRALQEQLTRLGSTDSQNSIVSQALLRTAAKLADLEPQISIIDQAFG